MRFRLSVEEASCAGGGLILHCERPALMNHPGVNALVKTIREEQTTALLYVGEGVISAVYEATEEIDGNEGRLGVRTIGYHETHHLAEIASKGRGVMGSQGTVRGKKVIWTDRNEFYVLENGPCGLEPRPDVVAKLKEAALAKLTAEEKKALGL